jgi:2,3-bisphosphoglycerate-independent phosphoglycerate mutase
VEKMGGRLIITADHGNAEKMWDEVNNEPYTAHTVDNSVPLVLVDDRYIGYDLRTDGRLADVAPTLLDVMGLPKPEEMTGESLIVKK